jgi:hypothetical protein
MRRAVAVLVATTLVALVIAPLALADNGTSQAGYGGEPAVQANLAANTQSNGGNLPFTGTDIGLFVLGGAVLVLVGLGMRRLGRQKQ